MALSGSYSSGSNPKLTVSWYAEQNITNNYSTLYQTIKLESGTFQFGAASSGTSSISGTSESFTVSSGISQNTTTTLYTQSKRINHDSSGYANNIALSASWSYIDENSRVVTISASTSVNLDQIDNGYPTVSIELDYVRGSYFTFTATASHYCNTWYYSLNNGQSILFGNQNTLSQECTVSNLNPGTTYTLRVTAYRTANNHSGTATKSVTTTVQSYLSSVSDVEIDAASPQIQLVAEISKPSYTHTLRIKKTSTGSAIVTRSSITDLVDGANTITLTSSEVTSLLNANTTSSSFRAYFELLTYNGSSQVGSTSTANALVYTTSTNSAPIFTGEFTYEDTNSTVTAITEDDQIIIQRQSTLRIFSPTATPKNQASISSYKVTIGSKTVSSGSGSTTTIDFGTIGDVTTDSQNRVSVELKVTDSRGYSTKITQKIPIIKYDDIDITNCVIDRRNGAEEPLTLDLDGSISSITIDNVEKNSVTYAAYRYKKTDETEWGNWAVITEYISTSGTSFSYQTDRLVSLDVNYSYDVEFKIQDIFSEDTAADDVGPGIPLVSFRKHKVGVNMNEPTSALDVSGIIKQNGFGILGYVGEITGDFNNYTTMGIYTYAASTAASHQPNAYDGVVLVLQFGTANVAQVFFGANATAGVLRMRVLVNGTWGSWSTK